VYPLKDVMTLSSALGRLLQQDDINFTLTNRIPRHLLTRLAGRVSRARHPAVRTPAMALWRFFGGDLHLEEARQAEFASLHDCFIRQLKDGARPVHQDPRTLVSPCDGIVGATGPIRDGDLLQAKGMRYTLADLLGDEHLAARYAGGHYVTLRLTSSMYHRFHAPADGALNGVTFMPGELWNVNPVSVQRIPRLYCRNERAALDFDLAGTPEHATLVAVGAILVGSIHIHALGRSLDQDVRAPLRLPCRTVVRRGEELGYFHHGSTIIVIATPGLEPCPHVRCGVTVRMGEALLQHR